MEKEPLYRKLNKKTHNGGPHHDYGFKHRERFERNGKRNKFEKEAEVTRPTGKNSYHNRNTDIGLFDYTPLYKFLLSMEGKDWYEVWSECNTRLNTMSPVLNMVVNVSERGVPIENHEYEHWYNKDFLQTYYKQIGNCYYPRDFNVGGWSKFSTMYVDDEGILRIVDPEHVPDPIYRGNTAYGETFNGKDIKDKDGNKKENTPVA